MKEVTFEELKKISDKNYGKLNRNIDPEQLDKTAIYHLEKCLIHGHALGKQVKPHYRAFVYRWYAFIEKDVMVGMQDITAKQWDKLKEV